MTELGWRIVDWAAAHPRPATIVVLLVLIAATVVRQNLTWVYRLTDKRTGQAYRVGIAKFGGLHRRMNDYRKGRDGSTKGDNWHRRVRWWTPAVSARLCRWAGRHGVSHTTCPITGSNRWPGWWRCTRTVELHLTRKRAKRYETVQIRSVQPVKNRQENPLYQKRPRRRMAA